MIILLLGGCVFIGDGYVDRDAVDIGWGWGGVVGVSSDNMSIVDTYTSSWEVKIGGVI